MTPSSEGITTPAGCRPVFKVVGPGLKVLGYQVFDEMGDHRRIIIFPEHLPDHLLFLHYRI
ncbi:MAG: hypothetical protein WC156_05150 [Pedobacter sp.]